MAHVKITSHGPATTTTIEIDGQRVPRVREYHVGQDVHGVPILELTIVCTELEIDLGGTQVEANPVAPERMPRHFQ